MTTKASLAIVASLVMLLADHPLGSHTKPNKSPEDIAERLAKQAAKLARRAKAMGPPPEGEGK